MCTEKIVTEQFKQMLGQNTREGLLNNNFSNTCDNFDFSNINFDAMYGSSSVTDNDLTHNSSFKNKSNRDFERLLDNYLCGGLPDKLMMEALKELNISDIKDFSNMINPNPSKNKTCTTTTISFRV